MSFGLCNRFNMRVPEGERNPDVIHSVSNALRDALREQWSEVNQQQPKIKWLILQWTTGTEIIMIGNR